MSLEVSHVFSWSLNRYKTVYHHSILPLPSHNITSFTWSFFISFLRSASYFSFWLALEALCTYREVGRNRRSSPSLVRTSDKEAGSYFLPDVLKLLHTLSHFLETPVNISYTQHTHSVRHWEVPGCPVMLEGGGGRKGRASMKAWWLTL